MHHKTLLLPLIILLLTISSKAQLNPATRFWKSPDNYSVLLLTKMAGWRHDSLPIAETTFIQLATLRNWTVTKADDLDIYFQSAQTLQRFDVIVFLLTSGPIFSETHQIAFKQYVDEGGAVVGVHSAADTNKHWPWFINLIGAEFVGHPDIQKAVMITQDLMHPSTSFMTPTWELIEEYYNFAQPLRLDDMHVLLRINESTYSGGVHGDLHPISWTRSHQPAGSRIWYTALGHSELSYNGAERWAIWFRTHLVYGVEWAANGTVAARARWLEFQRDFL